MRTIKITMMIKDGVTTFRLHLEMQKRNFARSKVLCMKPSALKRKSFNELFANNGASFDPRDAEHKLCQAYGRPSRQARHPRCASII